MHSSVACHQSTVRCHAAHAQQCPYHCAQAPPAAAPEAALCSADEPFWLCASMSQPAATSSRTTPACPLSAAASRREEGQCGCLSLLGRAGVDGAPRHCTALMPAYQAKLWLVGGTAQLAFPKHPYSSPHLHGVACTRSSSLGLDPPPPPAAGPQPGCSHCWRRCRAGSSRWWWPHPLCRVWWRGHRGRGEVAAACSFSARPL